MKPKTSCLGSAREWALTRDASDKALVMAVCGDYTIRRLAKSNFWEARHQGNVVFTGSLSGAAVACVGRRIYREEIQ